MVGKKITINYKSCKAALLFVVVALTGFFSTSVLRAQTHTYSQNFTQSAASTAQCSAWNVFQNQLTPGSYHTMRIWGTNDMTGLTLTDFTAVNAMATAIKNASTYISGTLNGHVWSVCNRYAGEVWVDPPASCSGSNCPSPGYILRPCIGGTNSNWGGVNTATCGAPSQLMAIEFIAGPPCPVPTNLTITAVYSTAVFFTWTPPAGSNGAEFVVDQNATGPTGTPAPTITTMTSATQGGLTPSTNYYLHVRNRCDSPGKSQWVTTSFTTLPPCILPPSINVPQIDTGSATVTWGSITPAIEYQYIIRKDKAQPDPAAATTTTSTQAGFTSLEPGTTYYVYVRAKCLGGDSSAWILDSFYVPLPCRAPEVKFSNVNDQRVVAYWDPPVTSYEYEILNSAVAIPNPTAGIKQKNTSFLFPYLDENTTYYVYAKCYCDDRGIKSESPWGSTTYKTWALGVGEMETGVNGLEVYPNPVRDEIAVSVKEVAGSGKISITDVAGKVVKEQVVTKPTIRMNAGDLAPGLYMLQYSDNRGSTRIKFYKE